MTSAAASAYDVGDYVDYSRLGRWTPEFEAVVDPQRALAYAAATNDPNPRYERGEVAPPLYVVVADRDAVVTGHALVMARRNPPPFQRLHGEHDVFYERPLIPGTTVWAKTALVGVRVRSSGSTLVFQEETRDSAGLLNRQFRLIFMPGIVRGEDAGIDPPPFHPPLESISGRPLHSITTPIDPDQTYRYAAASGDWSRFHIDEDFARSLGQPGIMVQGLCTMAMVGRSVVEACCGGDPARLKRFAVRFSKPVRPGDTLTTDIWSLSRNVYAVEAHSASGDKVIRLGRVEVLRDVLRSPEMTAVVSQGASPERATRTCDILIQNAYVLSMDSARTVYPRGAVAIDGTRIVAVGPEREVVPAFRPRRVIDARGAAVHPGLFDCHFHTILETTRGVFSDVLPRPEYSALYDRWYNALEAEDEYAAALLASIELVRNGVTMFMEPGTAFEPDAVADAVRAVGIRASLTDHFVWDSRDNPRAAAITRAPADTDAAIRRIGGQLYRNADPDSLIRGHVNVWGGGTASAALETAASELARSRGAIFNQHQSLTKASAEGDDARFGRHPLVHFAEIGVLGPHCTFVHMNHLRDDEIEAVVASGMSLVWCATTSMNWHVGAGTCRRWAELHDRGTNIASGTDAPRFGVGEQGLISFLLARDGGSLSIGAEEAFEMSTINGARALGVADRLGSLEPGKIADVVIRTDDMPEAHPGWDVVRSVALTTRTKSVKTVLVAGKVVVDDGHVVTLDEREAYATAHRSVDKLMKRVGITPATRWPVVA